MYDNEEKIKLTDLIDIKLLQKFQDTFAKAMNVASITVDKDGPITEPSNFSDFCLEYTKGSKLGIKKCVECDIKWGELAAEQRKPIVYTCRAGLTNFAVPIVVEGEHIGTILSGQVFIKHPNEEHFRKLTKKLGIDEDKYIEALEKIKTVSVETLDAGANLLYLVANAISNIGLENLQLIKRNKRASLYRTIIETIRNSLDINETKQKIVDMIGKTMMADRCFIAEYDKENDKFLIMTDEYLGSNDIISYKGVDLNKEFPNAVEILKKGKNIVINNKEFSEDINSENFRQEKEAIKKYKILSLFAFPLYYFDELLGVLSISYIKKKHEVNDDEINLLNVIANQISMAIYHAKLYEKEKATATKEIALRDTIKIIRSSLDAETIKQNFVEITYNYFKPDRCIFGDYNSETGNFFPFKIEMRQEEIKSLFNADIEELVPAFIKKIKNKKRNIIHKDIEKTLKRIGLVDSRTIKTLQEGDVKSDYGLLVQYKDKIIGLLIIHYVKNKRALTHEELDFLKVLSDQVGIALYQAQLFEKEKKTAERESLLRNITEKIRSSLDLDETLSFICDETAKLFNVQRTTITQFPDPKHYEEFIIRKEYKLSQEIIGFLQTQNAPQTAAYWGNLLMQNERVVSFNNINTSDAPDYFKNTYNLMGVKSMIGTSIKKGEDVWGTLILSEYNNYRQWTDEEKILIKAIADQVYIAINQSELFERAQKTAEKEKSLKEIIIAMRHSLDINQIFEAICTEIARILKLERIVIAEWPDDKNLSKWYLKYEYLDKNFKDRTLKGENIDKRYGVYWAEQIINKDNILVLDNIEESDVPDYFKNTYDLIGAKSAIGFSIDIGNGAWIIFALIKLDIPKYWTKDEINFIETIADQIYIAMNQAELFEKAQRKAEHEKTLREIMLLSVSTFDRKKIIKSIGTEAGKLFKADRCFYIEFDIETDTCRPIEDYAEYLSSNNIKSHLMRQPTKEEIIIFIELAKEKKVVFEDNAETADLPEATRKMLVDDLSVKSYLIAPVFYGDIFYGSMVFHYVYGFKQFTQEEIDMAVAIANQSAIVLHQAELFEITKIQAEREKISKNIIEILRSTLDKSIIKKLFVKNICKFLDADRVIFSEFNNETKMYSPVDKDSEYLSNPDMKSFIGYDWSCEQASEYIQPLLEKREFHIYNWEEYLQSNSRSQDFINLFDNMGAKSSYSFPVIQQQKIMGFFSIQFIRNVRRLMNEDINRIRNICTQAGIAFYHANLYEKAQKSIYAHAEFVNKLSDELKDPLNMIIEFSEMESSHELQCHEEIEHLNNVNNNAKKLLFLLDDIIKNSKTEIDFN